MRNNKLIFFNNVIYGLERDYGFRADLYRPVEVTDFKTGRKIVSRTKYHIKRAIFFPNQLFRDYKYASLFNQNMQFGGILDATQRRVLVNKKYLPFKFEIETTDYIIFNHDRYEIDKIDEMELADFWHVIIKKLVGQTVNEIHEQRIKSKLSFTEEIQL
jgi:hypothetical protein